MAFQKGVSGHPEGKPVGAKNKIGEQLRQMISDFLNENFETIQQDFSTLKPIERAKIYCELLQYGLPKLQSVGIDIEQTSFQLVKVEPKVISTGMKIANSESEIEL